MNDNTDDAQSYALFVLAGVLALVVAGVIGVAILTSGKAGNAEPVAGASAASAVEMQSVAAEPAPDGSMDLGQRIQFEPGSDTLPVAASVVLGEVAEAARRRAGAMIAIVPFQQAPGGATQDDADLARRRGLAVQGALAAMGLAPEQMLIEPGEVMENDPDPGAPDRVEVRML